MQLGIPRQQIRASMKNLCHHFVLPEGQIPRPDRTGNRSPGDDEFQLRFGGYNEIQEPRRKCALISYGKLAELSKLPEYHAFQKGRVGY
jgi:hypothetical protein